MAKKSCVHRQQILFGLGEGPRFPAPEKIGISQAKWFWLVVYLLLMVLVGGFNYFLFSPLFGEDFQFD